MQTIQNHEIYRDAHVSMPARLHKRRGTTTASITSEELRNGSTHNNQHDRSCFQENPFFVTEGRLTVTVDLALEQSYGIAVVG